MGNEDMVMKKKKILIFGTSHGAVEVLEILDLNKVVIVGFIDNNKSLHGKLMDGIEISGPLNILANEYDYIVIGSMYYDEIKMQLIQMSIAEEKIVKLLNYNEKTSKQKSTELFRHNEKYMNLVKDDQIYKYFKNYAICDMHILGKSRNLKLNRYPDTNFVGGIDFVRVSTLELISREIKENNIEGVVAELGVYKGDFSKLISDFFVEKKLILFDTFEGFSKKDVDFEREENLSNTEIGGFGDTNIELVIKKIGRESNLIVKKGYFPDTTMGLQDEIYSFVSIDVDLYTPTIEGLRYFYKRLSQGGYILIHDYNHPNYKGVKKAVKEFCAENKINVVPMSDYFGSAIISK